MIVKRAIVDRSTWPAPPARPAGSARWVGPLGRPAGSARWRGPLGRSGPLSRPAHDRGTWSALFADGLPWSRQARRAGADPGDAGDGPDGAQARDPGEPGFQARREPDLRHLG